MGDGDKYFNGKVGIGTTSPSENFEVNGKVKIAVNSADATVNILQLQNISDDNDGGIALSFSNNDNIVIGSIEIKRVSTGDYTTIFKNWNGTDNTEYMRVTADNTWDHKVGIGENAPKEKLVVRGAVKIADGGYNNIFANAAAPEPAGGPGTIIFSSGGFFGWDGSKWKQLDN